MYCYQCRQDSYDRICRVRGICAKDPACMAVEEYLLQGLKSISIYVNKIIEYGGSLEGFSDIAIKIFFLSVMNLGSDNDEIMKALKELDIAKDEFKRRYNDIIRARGFQVELLDQSLYWQPKYKLNEIIREGEQLSVRRCKGKTVENKALEELLILSVRGMVRYAIQAKTLGFEREEITRFLCEVVYALTRDLGEEELLRLLDKSGEINLLALKMLEAGLFNRYGVDEKVRIKTSPVAGKAVLVSGRDLKDLEDILKATISKNINVYTHGEMMLAHVFPELRAFPNLVGNYGGFSVDQQSEVESFPGAVLITSNCAWDPPEIYRGRVFSTGMPSWPGIKQIINQNYSPLINAALDSEGFKTDFPPNTKEVGFNYDQFDENILKLKKGVKDGSIKHIFLLVGCSSSSLQRDYMDKFISLLPENCVVMKFSGLGNGGKGDSSKSDSRVMEFGLFDDLLSVIKIFTNAKDDIRDIINSDMFSMVFFLREQSAISVLMSILKFKTKRIKIGSCFPSLVSPLIFRGIKHAYGVQLTSTPEADIKEFLGL